MLGFIPPVEAGWSQPHCKLLFSEQPWRMANVEGEGAAARLHGGLMVAQTLQAPAISSLVFPFMGPVLAGCSLVAAA